VVKTKSGDVRVAATGASQNGVMRVPAIEAGTRRRQQSESTTG